MNHSKHTAADTVIFGTSDIHYLGDGVRARNVDGVYFYSFD
jgi:hypothetical protein